MSESIIYTCKRCGESMSAQDLEYRGGEVKCIHCSYKVVMKTKPPVVKRVSTR